MSSFGFIGSLFSYYWGGSKSSDRLKADPIEEELKILMDATVLSTPSLLKDGFDLFIMNTTDVDTRIGENISHLSELDLHTPYMTQKGTKVNRTSQFEVTLGENLIFIPILKRGETYETTRNLSQLCMKGQLYPESLVVAVENFCGSRIKEQGALFYANGNSRNVFVSEDLSNLESGVTYVAPNGSILLRRLHHSKRIDFSFGRNLFSPVQDKKSQNKNQNLSNTSNNSRSIRKRGRRGRATPGLLQSLSTNTPSPLSPRLVSRSTPALKKRTFNAMESPINSPGPDLESISPVKQDSDSKRPKRDENKENTENFSPKSPSYKLITHVSPPIIALPLSPPPPPPAPLVIPAPPPPAPPKAPSVPPPPRAAVTPTTRRRRLRPLHWKAIPRNKLQSTFWSKIDNIDIVATPSKETPIEHHDELDKEVIGVFALSPEKQEENGAKPNSFDAKFAAKQKITILDVKRSNNIGILLSQFKMTFMDIRQSLLELDSLLTTEHLISLKYMFPLTEEEKAAFEEFRGDKESLGSAERFYLEMLQVPRLEQKINFFLFKKQFEEQIEALRESATILASACEELKNSEQFAKILKWIFTIGSCLNKDTRLGESAGFSLESLPKITETKSGQGNFTFMDFLVTKVEAKNPELLHFEEELPNLELGSKISLDILNNHRKETENEINELRKEISFYENIVPGTLSPQDKFLSIMKPFLAIAEETFSSVSNVLNEAINTFHSVVEYFGDDVKSTNPSLFFQNIVLFAHGFRRAHHAFLEKQRRSELAKANEIRRQKTPKSRIDPPLFKKQPLSMHNLLKELPLTEPYEPKFDEAEKNNLRELFPNKERGSESQSLDLTSFITTEDSVDDRVKSLEEDDARSDIEDVALYSDNRKQKLQVKQSVVQE